MTKIHLSIEAESATELQSAINELATSGVQHHLAGAEPAQQPVQEWSQNEPAPAAEQPKAEEPKKRKRRTKAEIEADKKAEAEKEAEVNKNVDHGADRTSDQGPNGAPPPSAEVVELKQEPEAPAEQPTLQDVRAAMQAMLDANGGEQMLGVLRDLGAINEEGHTKASALAEEKYAEAIEKMTALTAEIKAKSDEAGSLLG